MKEPTQIIANIRLTEKASLLGERHNQYVFRVATARQQNRDQAGDRKAVWKESCAG